MTGRVARQTGYLGVGRELYGNSTRQSSPLANSSPGGGRRRSSRVGRAGVVRVGLAQIFGAANVGILTGDRREHADAPIIIGTTEILRNQLYDAMHTGVTLETDFVVLDEAHFLGDYDRGVVWEEIMIYLPARIPLLLLSATIGNAQEIADWLSAEGGTSGHE